MIYSIFIKKSQGDKKPFNLVTTLKNYLNMHDNLFLLGWPGYISINRLTIDAFKQEISPTNKNVEGYFFDALNGLQNIVNPITGNNITKIDYMNQIFGGYTCTHNNLRDHSKILALIEFKNNVSSNDITKLLQNGHYDVKALLVGSSNQSLHTYANSPADKGEADIFMFETNELSLKDERTVISSLLGISNEVNTERVNVEFFNNIVVTKEVCSIKVSSNLKQIVKKILDETL